MSPKSGRLPFWSTFRRTHTYLRDHAYHLAQHYGLLLLAFVVANAVMDWFYFPRNALPADAIGWLDITYGGILLLLSSVLLSIVSIQIHRHIILSEIMDAGSLGQLAGSWRWRRIAKYIWICIVLPIWFVILLCFLFWVSILTLTLFPLGIGLEKLASPACVICIVLPCTLIPIAAYFPTRFYLALPATAIDSSDKTFADSWSATKNNFLPLFLCTSYTWMPMITLSYLSADDQSRLEYIGMNAFANCALIYGVLVWAVFFSFAYKHLTGGSEAATESEQHLTGDTP